MSKIKVWWVPQVPMKAFEVTVPDIETGAWLCEVLADYDFFQFENHVKPDYSNMGGVMFLDSDGEWCEIDTDDQLDVEWAKIELGLL